MVNLFHSIERDELLVFKVPFGCLTACIVSCAFSLFSPTGRKEQRSWRDKTRSKAKSGRQRSVTSNSSLRDVTCDLLLLESTSMSSTMKSSSADTSGWGVDDSEWGTFDAPPPKSTAAAAADSTSSGLSRQELLQKKREERRLKQQEAREKRAAGAKSGGLGAVKKD